MQECILDIDPIREHQLLRVRVPVPFDLNRLIGFHQGRSFRALQHFSCFRLVTPESYLGDRVGTQRPGVSVHVLLGRPQAQRCHHQLVAP